MEIVQERTNTEPCKFSIEELAIMAIASILIEDTENCGCTQV